MTRAVRGDDQGLEEEEGEWLGSKKVQNSRAGPEEASGKSKWPSQAQGSLSPFLHSSKVSTGVY